jgi:uncharacterized membrane protein (UPF0127 family)
MTDVTPAAPGRRRPLRLAAGALGLLLVATGIAVAAAWLLSAAREPRPAAATRVAGYRLEPAGRPPVRVRLEVAADPAGRARGLMGRARLAPGTGMVFLFPADVRDAFWMKDTLVPLSIAFLAADGTVVGIRDMAPCRADPCPSYEPAGRYRSAVELPAGAFRDAGVSPGDRVVPEDPEALPQAS